MAGNFLFVSLAPTGVRCTAESIGDTNMQVQWSGGEQTLEQALAALNPDPDAPNITTVDQVEVETKNTLSLSQVHGGRPLRDHLQPC